MLQREGQLVPDGFLNTSDGLSEPAEPAFDVSEGASGQGESIRWPAYTSAAVGLALMGTGIAIGLDSRANLENLRVNQTRPGACGPDFCNSQLGSLENRARLADGL